MQHIYVSASSPLPFHLSLFVLLCSVYSTGCRPEESRPQTKEMGSYRDTPVSSRAPLGPLSFSLLAGIVGRLRQQLVLDYGAIVFESEMQNLRMGWDLGDLR